MKKNDFSDKQIMNMLYEIEADICRKHGISSQTYYAWNNKYGKMNTSNTKRIKKLEEENIALKRMFADMALENNTLKNLIQKDNR